MALIPKNYRREDNLEPGNSGKDSENTVAKAIDDKISAAESNPSNQNQEDGRSKEWEDRARINLDPQPDATTNVERDFEPEKISHTEGKDKDSGRSVY